MCVCVCVCVRKFAKATNALCRQRWQYGYVTVYISIAIYITNCHVNILQPSIRKRVRPTFLTAVTVWKMEMCPRRCSGEQTCIHQYYLQELCISARKWPRSSTAAFSYANFQSTDVNIGQRSFAFSGPTVCNSFLSALRGGISIYI